MKIIDYKKIKSLDTGSTTYIQEVCSITGIDNKLPYSEVNKLLLEAVNIEPNEIIPRFYKLGKKIYKYEKDLLTATFEQFSLMDMLLAEENNMENMGKLLAIYLRPVNMFFKIKKFDIKTHQENAKHIEENMNIEDAFGLMVFFYHYALECMEIINTYYLERLTMKP